MSDIAIRVDGTMSDRNEGVRVSQSEIASVILVTVSVHLVMLMLGLPLPHSDLSTYVEPALLLAEKGILAGPATQHQDLLYTAGFYSYPPGYFLLLAGWIKFFGPGMTSLLGYTHLVHSVFMFAAWLLLRLRFHATRLAAALAIASLFPI